ncbi:PAS domain S-box-containing protein/diguanylate cyclase (GGDEF) domain-containing protein [Evansella caseinilytica]|uniref:PAS domain S-box-containing protein/diguanylate cyclase (GGDEF) domain-containing protein n=1 Tax=Evansella caseinilytica TaxID=1503961 RepID=A0A1H3HF15_9BACI|nr:PAS domain S-box-containing protein/diguanylate cyclase (GGDEF) domain-containing protein [Evansella caseinilytica]
MQHNASNNSISFSEAYKALFENNPDACYALDQKGNFCLFNEAAMKLTGYSLEEMLGTSFIKLVPEAFLTRIMNTFHSILRGNEEKFELSIFSKNGSVIDLYVTAVPIVMEGTVQGIIGIAKDMTELYKVQEELRESRSQLQNIVDSITVCLWSADVKNGELLYISPACSKIFGYTQKEFYTTKALWQKMMYPQADDTLAEQFAKIKNGKKIYLEYPLESKRGDILWVNNSIVPVLNDSGGLERVDGVLTDISWRKQAEKELKYMAFHDHLTNLPNRRRFNEKLRRAMDKAKQEHRKVAVMYLDLDRFKYINDALGHKEGDELLKQVAERLTCCLGEDDLVARQGGDEFSIILQSITELHEVCRVSEKIHDLFNTPVELKGYEYNITTSIGVSIYPDHADSVEGLIKRADQALYLAKDKGRSNTQIYNGRLSKMMSRKFVIEQGLRKAVDKREFSLLYQPIVHVQTKKIVGFEALIRWNYPVLGELLPLEFIPAAEETGEIISIGEWVLRQAIADCKSWQRGRSPIYVTVNISARQVEQPELIQRINGILAEKGLAQEYLKLEITEGAAMTNIDRLLPQFRKLQDAGVDIALDDFGTGYSSLNYLKIFPIKTLKIDRSFVKDIHKDPKQEAIIKTMAALAENLQLDLIAEGVEQEQQIAFLKEIGCYKMQGYYFQKPVPADEVRMLLRDN